MSRLRRSRHRVALTKVMGFPLLQRRLSDDAIIWIQIVPPLTTLSAQATRRSSKVVEAIAGPDDSQGAVPPCSGTPVLSESGEEIDGMEMASR